MSKWPNKRAHADVPSSNMPSNTFPALYRPQLFSIPQIQFIKTQHQIKNLETNH